jgi:hypothetical protein
MLRVVVSRDDCAIVFEFDDTVRVDGMKGLAILRRTAVHCLATLHDRRVLFATGTRCGMWWASRIEGWPLEHRWPWAGHARRLLHNTPPPG